MTSYTPNGYAVIDDYADPALIGNPTVPGTSTTVWGGINRKYAPILIWVAQQFNARVEPIKIGDPADDWGYNKRQSRNSSNISEHSAGTAIDLNASGHPNGQRPTANMTAAQVAACRAIAAETGGAVRWGGEWNDAQHFELTSNRAAVDRFLAKLAGGGAPPPSTGTPPPAPSSRPAWPFTSPADYLGRIDNPSLRSHGGDPRYDGPAVIAAIRYAQQCLRAMGYDKALVVDGIFGRRTGAAVSAWQTAKYRPQTTRFGEVWSDDWSRL